MKTNLRWFAIWQLPKHKGTKPVVAHLHVEEPTKIWDTSTKNTRNPEACVHKLLHKRRMTSEEITNCRINFTKEERKLLKS